MNSNMTNIHENVEHTWKMLNSRNKILESLVEKYKGPGYCNYRYGNADICFNVSNFKLRISKSFVILSNKGRFSDSVLIDRSQNFELSPGTKF